MTIANRWWLWVAVNVVGIICFFDLAVRSWIEPELANEPGASGGTAFYWAVTALPVFLLFTIANLALGLVAMRQLAHGQRTGLVAVTVLLIAWLVSYYFDNLHHGV